jgi:hypothetical protein
MNEDEVIKTLQSFSEKNGFKYDRAPVANIPFGGITGTINGGIFTLYISRSESRIHGRYHTHFTLQYHGLIPAGFCIKYEGNPNKKYLGFDDRIVDLSTDRQVNFLPSQIKESLTSAFDQIDIIDEELFNLRSSLRISESGIALIVSRLFQNIDELNAVYLKVIRILRSIDTALSKT